MQKNKKKKKKKDNVVDVLRAYRVSLGNVNEHSHSVLHAVTSVGKEARHDSRR